MFLWQISTYYSTVWSCFVCIFVFFILPICAAWSLSGSTHFQSQYTLFIENFVLITWSLDKEEKPVQLPWMSNSIVKSHYAYWASSLSWNKPTQQAGQKIYIIKNYKIRIEWICLWSKQTLLLRQASSGWVNLPRSFNQLLRFFSVIKIWVLDNTE